MFGWLRRNDPRRALERQYRQAMQDARDIQRRGDIVGYAARIAEAEQIRARLEALEQGSLEGSTDPRHTGAE